jgi:uncharacterized protein (UPF0262 family)
MTWQPIETAPLHTVVLVWFGRIGMHYNVMRSSQSGWVEATDDGRRLKEGYEPSHWMHLPSPPEATR